MAVVTVRVGRPHCVADINFANERKQLLFDEFYKICKTFHYREIMALSRALGVCPHAVVLWKYKLRTPRWDTVVDIFDWVDRGKPMKLVQPSRVKKSLL